MTYTGKLHLFTSMAAARAFCREADRPLLVLAPDDGAMPVPVVWKLEPTGKAEKSDHLYQIPNGNYRTAAGAKSEGTEYVVLRRCSLCSEWDVVDALLRFIDHHYHSALVSTPEAHGDALAR